MNIEFYSNDAEEKVEETVKNSKWKEWLSDPDNQVILGGTGLGVFMLGVTRNAIKTMQYKNLLNVEQRIGGYEIVGWVKINRRLLKKIMKEKMNGKSTYEALKKLGLLKHNLY